MKLGIANIRRATPEEWDQIWNGCHFATYFHSREWFQIWQTYSHGKFEPYAHCITFSDGGMALWPMAVRKHRFKQTWYSSPAGTYGGWISAEQFSEAHQRQLVQLALKSFRRLSWRLHPFAEPPRIFIDGEGDLAPGEKQEDETMLLHLSAPYSDLFRSWRLGHRQSIQAAERAGVSVRPARDVGDWEKYYEIYQDCLRRWGGSASSKYDWELFDRIHRLNSPHPQLWLALHEGEIIAGALNFNAHRKVMGWHCVALERAFELRPVHLLMAEMIRDACGRGFEWYDFNPSGGHTGSIGFKKGFRAAEVPTPMLRLRRSWSEYVRRRWAARRRSIAAIGGPLGD